MTATHHHPVEVTQVAHDETHTVDITLAPVEWRQIIGDIARRIYVASAVERRRVLPLVYAAGRPDNDLDRVDALTELVNVLAMPAPVFTVTPDVAAEIALDLLDAGHEPTTCRCGRFVDKPSDLTDTCGICTDRGDRRLRVVGA